MFAVTNSARCGVRGDVHAVTRALIGQTRWLRTSRIETGAEDAHRGNKHAPAARHVPLLKNSLCTVMSDKIGIF